MAGPLVPSHVYTFTRGTRITILIIIIVRIASCGDVKHSVQYGGGFNCYWRLQAVNYFT